MPPERPASRLAREYGRLEHLLASQSPRTRQFLEGQAAALADALQRERGALRYRLPDRLILEGGETTVLPRRALNRSAGRAAGDSERCERLLRSLNGLEQGLNPALAACGSLLRFTLARHLLHERVPDGPRVTYLAESGDDIPSLPSGEAPGFFLPEWVAFGQGDRLLVASLQDAEACVARLEAAARLLGQAALLCPALATEAAFQRKRWGVVGQLVNQGRALARHHARGITARLKARAAAGSLDRGLSLSLPFFDDEALAMRLYPVQVIPAGRIPFLPELLVRALGQSEERLRRAGPFSPSTRRHLLALLAGIENEFRGGPGSDLPATQPAQGPVLAAAPTRQPVAIPEGEQG